jgi:hypothetical protein
MMFLVSYSLHWRVIYIISLHPCPPLRYDTQSTLSSHLYQKKSDFESSALVLLALALLWLFTGLCNLLLQLRCVFFFFFISSGG